jgi:hypothetical protein
MARNRICDFLIAGLQQLRKQLLLLARIEILKMLWKNEMTVSYFDSAC